MPENKPIIRKQIFNTSQDAASTVWATYTTGANRGQGAVIWDIAWTIGTAASLTLKISDTELATATVDIILAKASTTIGWLQSDTIVLKASSYANLQWGATTTVRWFTITERVQW